jgi:hypothetical protein
MARWLKVIDDVLKVKVHHLQTGRIKNSEFIDWVDKQPTVEPKQEYISVKDRPPEEGQEVLCFCAGNLANVYTWTGEEWEDSYGYYEDDDIISHWMPLPEPPKEA